MKIGIDISQLVYTNTGVANYLENLVENLIPADLENDYVLFFSSLRRSVPESITTLAKNNNNVNIKKFKFPPFF